MHLVLTHEQADFDALAALFAAAYLEGALPVLPRRMNRNVRSFISLYGLEFPFVDPRDLAQGPIETVILVDTQSLITLKGMSSSTQVRVFDHHKLRATHKVVLNKKSVPMKWDVLTFELGATTTYFVELMRERGEVLSSVQSTLLLLGIYEDTGTLTYSRTTSRDALAVAWLLEQGADLRSVTDYLNPSLSIDQRELYDRLVNNIKTYEINGHQVMVTQAESGDSSDEISTLAHKLRDLFDPDALFVFVQTVEGIRLVARSSTDQVDVSSVAEHFGGGGHTRAAAALVKRPEDQPVALEPVVAELLALLPGHIRPAISVAQLMSKRPKVISADTQVEDAAMLMARYGYEGFPVISEGKVVGLLTRRAVDRAMSHKLIVKVVSLMEAGQVFVHPGDSLQHLQAVMTDSGWGQVPVVEPETLKLVGIVTRTDVLKMLSHRHPRNTQTHSLVGRLKKTLPPAELALIAALADQAVEEHMPVYIVGGFVRDLMLGHPGADLDMVVEGDAIKLGKSLVSKYGGRLTSHSRFGTARWYLQNSQLQDQVLPEYLDLISARQEYYEHPSALPVVEHGSIKLDLHRRDFTINTLAVRLDGRHYGELHDYFGGLKDLEHHLVRVLHSLSFVDDPTRMLRAVRYEQRYGFKIENRTLQLMDEARPLIARLTPERLRHELDLILEEPGAATMLARLAELGLIKAISEILPWNPAIFDRLERILHAEMVGVWADIGLEQEVGLLPRLGYSLWLLDIPEEKLEQLHARLNFPILTFKTIQAVSNLLPDLVTLHAESPSVWTRRLDGLPLFALYVAWVVSREDALEHYVSTWRHIHAGVNGHTLRSRGLVPGPYFEDILQSLRNAWLDGRVNSATEEEILLEELIRQQNLS
jgi:tRNA nucleotidyltransferase (CCA-adding enzyme)